MPKNTKIVAVMAILGLALAPFTNCGQYSEQKSSDLTSTSTDCDADCITPTLENLSLTPHLGGSTQYTVRSDQIEFNLGGACNEGGYPYNSIRWELMLNGVSVRNSGMSGIDGSAANAHRTCVNGKMHLYINLAAIPGDNVVRTGLKTGVGTTRAPYDLYLEIYGMDSSNDPQPKRNPAKARVAVSLIPTS